MSQPGGAARPLKIFLIIGTLGRGGAEGQLSRLAIELQGLGHSVTVVALIDGGPQVEMLTAANVPWQALGDGHGLTRSVSRDGTFSRLRGRAVYGATLIRTLVRLCGLLRRERPDVCHAWLWLAYVLAIPASAACRVPVRIAGLRALQQPRERSVIGRLASWPARHLVHGITANCEAIAEQASALKLFSATACVRVIPNAVDVPSWVADPGGDPPVVICVANLIAYKGHRTALDAWRLLKRPPQLRLVGEGPEGDDLRDLVQIYGLATKVQFLGSVAGTSDLVRSSQIALLPSLTEGFPNALIEAMAAGLPAVATAVGGVPEVLDSSCGIVVPPGDAAAMAAAVDELVQDQERRIRLGAAAREKVKAYSWSRCVDANVRFYRELLRD